MTSIEPSRLRETRAGYREIPIHIRAVDVMAGGGGGAGPAPSIRRQDSRARYTGRNMHNHDINTIISMFLILYLVSVLLQCSGNACEQYAEDLGFEARLHLF